MVFNFVKKISSARNFVDLCRGMNYNECKELTSAVVALSKEIGDWMCQQNDVSEYNADIKTENNLVTYVDKESEARFVQGLSKLLPEAGFIAEEGTGVPVEGGLNWVIDPLDGTTNFVHKVPIWCTSVALCDGPRPILGVIYNPNGQTECFEAFEGGGAKLNNQPIRVSGIQTLNKSLLVTGFPYDDFGREQQYLQLLRDFTHRTRGMRRLGSAALDLAWTACGRFESFYEYGLNPWDVAAGVIIVNEAGGLCTEFNAGPNVVFGEDIIASNGLIHDELIAVVNLYFGQK
jgi:myo-inositol-1(or 4)-monophosphatase